MEQSNHLQNNKESKKGGGGVKKSKIFSMKIKDVAYQAKINRVCVT